MFPRALLAPFLGALASCSTSTMSPSTEPKPFLGGALAHYHVDDAGLAVQGYDVVSYYDVGGGRPVPGRAEHALELDGITYRFASAKNRELFRANPGRYAPTYGGWCAHAMADGGRKVTIDPENYTLESGRLFLFFKAWYADARANWLRDGPAELTPKADANWKQLTGEDPRRP
jgi:YHS domain-containing protein